MKKIKSRYAGRYIKSISKYQLKTIKAGDLVVIISGRSERLIVTEVLKLAASRPNCFSAEYDGTYWDVPFSCIVKKIKKEQHPEYFL